MVVIFEFLIDKKKKQKKSFVDVLSRNIHTDLVLKCCLWFLPIMLYKNIPLGKLIKSCNFFDYLKFKMAARTHNAN